MDNRRILIYLTICCCVAAEIKINELVVPGEVEHRKNKSVVLDCIYEFDAKDTELSIKWFFQNTTLVYQWLPGAPPIVHPTWNDTVVNYYNVSNDPNTVYRALKIINVTPNITGEYQCKVSSFNSEASDAKKMIIYEPPTSFTFDHIHNTSTLLCSASDVFPKPVIIIYANELSVTDLKQNNDSNEGSAFDEDDLEVVENSYGLYNVTTSFHYDLLDVGHPVDFICKLFIPDTTFNITIRKTIRPAADTTSTTRQFDTERSTIQSIVFSENSATCLSWNAALLILSILLTHK